VKAVLGALAVGACVVTPASAQDEVIETRQAVMELNVNAIGLAYDMSEGDIAFDPKVARTAILSIAADLQELPGFLP
jgi:cytochrome c556